MNNSLAAYNCAGHGTGHRRIAKEDVYAWLIKLGHVGPRPRKCVYGMARTDQRRTQVSANVAIRASDEDVQSRPL